MNRTRAVLTALTLSAGLTLAGCSSDDPEPRHDPTPTVSTSPVESTPTGPVEPTMPAEAQGTSKQAAEAFVGFYWEMVNYAQQTGELSGLSSLTSKCLGCESGAKFIQRSYADGGYIRGGDGVVNTELVTFIKVKGDWLADATFVVTSTKQQVFNSSGDKVESYPGGRSRFEALLEPTDDAWLVRSLDVK